MTKPLLLDLCCAQGGAGEGYTRAGFEVVGVDIDPQPRNPHEFIQADVLDVLADEDFILGFDVIHASPPCQRYANVTRWRGSQDNHPDLLPKVLGALEGIGLPYVVENVPGAPLRVDLTLCGSQMGLRVKRHRNFQSNVPLAAPDTPCRHEGLLPFVHKQERAYADAMGCTWMTAQGARESIPPAYTEFIGHQVREYLMDQEEAA